MKKNVIVEEDFDEIVDRDDARMEVFISQVENSPSLISILHHKMIIRDVFLELGWSPH